MKTHFGFFENYGDYESPCYGVEETICGYTGEEVLEEYTVENWDLVTCKKCLRLKDAVKKGIEEDEKVIVEQMGDMVEFLTKEEIKT